MDIRDSHDSGGTVDQEWHSLLVPDVITPEQHCDRVRAEATDRPEVRIMLAVLADAVATYRRGIACRAGGQGRRPFREVVQWFASTDDAPLYSFERICSTLRFDAPAIREGLERWSERQSGASAPPLKRLAFRRSNERRFVMGSTREPKSARRSATPRDQRRAHAAR